jgi:plasmid stabilization system protein ParE
MKSIVHFRPDAENDIANAAAWYEIQKTGLGSEFLDEVLSTCNSIAENPELYPLVHRKARRAVIHKFPFGIYYRIENGLVTIVAVLHGSRDPNRWKSRT